MTLTEQQIEYIATNLKFYGIATEELHSDILDHVCTYIENGSFEDFESAYNEAIQKFGGYEAMGRIETNTYLLTTFKKNTQRQKLVYISGFISVILLLTGMLFKLMHWPGASIILFTCFIVLIFVFLPVIFYHKYKVAYKKSLSQ